MIRPFIYQWNVLLDETQEEIQVGSIRKSTISDKVQSRPKNTFVFLQEMEYLPITTIKEKEYGNLVCNWD